MDEKILLVDDDVNLLEAMKRNLHEEFNVDFAFNGPNALALVQKTNYAVVLSDMTMPGMDGVTLLSKVKEISPDTTRVILTGNTDLQTAIDAVNKGNIFRFLIKPSAPETIKMTLSACIDQYHLVTAEKEILEKTLSGSIKMLTEILAVLSPRSFSRTSRLVRITKKMVQYLKMNKSWTLDIAVMLSQIGSLVIPDALLQRYYMGGTLNIVEKPIIAEYPKTGYDLIKNIPRLGAVAKIILYQCKNYDGSGFPEGELSKEDIPVESRLLKVALDYDLLTLRNMPHHIVINMMKNQKEQYDPLFLSAVENGMVVVVKADDVKEVQVLDLTNNMVIARNILSLDGKILINQGLFVTPYLQLRINKLLSENLITGPIPVIQLS